MGFRERLEEVCAVEGAVAASVMGFDGIAVETVTAAASGVDLESLMVEYAGVLAQVRQAAELLQTGPVSEMSVGTERLTTILRLINRDYFLVLAMRPEGNFGKGRFVLRTAAPRLQAEL